MGPVRTENPAILSWRSAITASVWMRARVSAAWNRFFRPNGSAAARGWVWRWFMERYEGQIEIQSELNKGTTVRLVFPLRQPAHPKGDGLPAAAKETSPLRLL